MYVKEVVFTATNLPSVAGAKLIYGLTFFNAKDQGPIEVTPPMTVDTFDRRINLEHLSSPIKVIGLIQEDMTGYSEFGFDSIAIYNSYREEPARILYDSQAYSGDSDLLEYIDVITSTGVN